MTRPPTDDDDTPEHIVAAMNAHLLAKAGEGRHVIYIHGRPYPDPGDPPPPENGESPFPWDLWDE